MVNWATCAISVVAIVALVVFCRGKKEGFGPYNTSTLVLVLVTSLTAILASVGKIDSPDVGAILLAAIGFAGGLFAGGRGKENEGSKGQ